MTNSSQPPANPPTRPDPQAVIVAVTGLCIVLLIVLIAVLMFPGPVPQGQTNSTGQNIVSVATAAITAVGAVVAAYFGIKTANSAREDTAHKLADATQRLDAARIERVAAANRNEIAAQTIVGKLPPDQAKDALQEVDARIKAAGLV
jgi:hypothetical protein